MNRRKFIAAAAGGASTLLLAGCTGEDPEYSDSNNSTASGGDNGLEITEHEMVAEETSIGTDVYVRGTVENTADEMQDYAEVAVRVFDTDDRQLDSYFTNTTDLGPGSEWAFEIMVLEDAGEIGDYDITVSDNAL